MPKHATSNDDERITSKREPWGKRIVVSMRQYRELEKIADHEDRSTSYIGRAMIEYGLKAYNAGKKL